MNAISEITTGGSYNHGLETLKKYFLEVLLITLVVWVLVTPYYVAHHISERSDSAVIFIVEMFALGFWLLILGPVEWGANYAMLRAVRGDKPEIADIFIFQKNYLNIVLAHLLVTVIIGVGIFLLIVPGIFFACKLAFVSYLVTDRKMEVTEAIRESWRMTAGHAGTIFLMGLAAAGLFIAGLLLLVIGVVPAMMWIDLSFASIYNSVASKGALPESG